MLKKILLIGLALSIVSGCANMPANPKKLPKDLKVTKTAIIPNPTELAAYIPESAMSRFYYDRYSSRTVEYGQSMQKGFMDVSEQFFPNLTLKGQNPNKTFGLFLDLQPKWDVESGKVVLTYQYQILNTELEVILTGSQTHSENINFQMPENTFYNASVRASQKMFVDIANKLLKEQKTFEASRKISDVPNQLLANMETPISTSVAYKVNDLGHFLTSLSELNSCLVTKVEFNDELHDIAIGDNTLLLDMVIFKTDISHKGHLRFSPETITPGTSVTTLSYKLDKDSKEATPLLSFGHVLLTEGISGSLGTYQFSTATAPESKGAPVLNSQGHIVGMFTGDYNTAYLEKYDYIPKNNQFALKDNLVKKFLDIKGIPYSVANTNQKTDVTKAIMANTVKLNCYQ